jgi:metal-sulfur cluster biosynthetic enzyme
LIYDVSSDGNKVNIRMTLTAPGCPVAEEMPKWVEVAILDVEGVKDVVVEMVFDPPWDISLMSDEARLALNMY